MQSAFLTVGITDVELNLDLLSPDFSSLRRALDSDHKVRVVGKVLT